MSAPGVYRPGQRVRPAGGSNSRPTGGGRAAPRAEEEGRPALVQKKEESHKMQRALEATVVFDALTGTKMNIEKSGALATARRARNCLENVPS